MLITTGYYRWVSSGLTDWGIATPQYRPGRSHKTRTVNPADSAIIKYHEHAAIGSIGNLAMPFYNGFVHSVQCISLINISPYRTWLRLESRWLTAYKSIVRLTLNSSTRINEFRGFLSQFSTTFFSWNSSHTIFHSCRDYSKNFAKFW